MFQKWNPTKLQACLHKKNRAIAPMPNNLQSIHGVMTTRLSHFRLDVASRTNGMGGGSGPYDRLYLYPSGKLAFCGIPKAGITQWLHFLRFTIGAKDYQKYTLLQSNWMHAQQFRFDRLKRPEIQEQVWNDASWTKAIFIRDPAERVLSANLDTVVQTHEKQRKPPFGYNVSFAPEFIDILSSDEIRHGVNKTHGAMTGLSCMSDPHWLPQAWSCGRSLGKYIKV